MPTRPAPEGGSAAIPLTNAFGLGANITHEGVPLFVVLVDDFLGVVGLARGLLESFDNLQVCGTHEAALEISHGLPPPGVHPRHSSVHSAL